MAAGRPVFLSTGASSFKLNRGSREALEYEAVFTAHLGRARQLPWGVARSVYNLAARSLDTTLARIANAGFGIVHRDLGRRYSDQFIADAAPTPSVVAGVDAPCQRLDATLASLRKLQSTTIAELDRARSLPSWLPPAAPACSTVK